MKKLMSNVLVALVAFLAVGAAAVYQVSEIEMPEVVPEPPVEVPVVPVVPEPRPEPILPGSFIYVLLDGPVTTNELLILMQYMEVRHIGSNSVSGVLETDVQRIKTLNFVVSVEGEFEILE